MTRYSSYTAALSAGRKLYGAQFIVGLHNGFFTIHKIGA